MADYTTDLLISQSTEIDKLRKENRRVKDIYIGFIIILILLFTFILVVTTILAFKTGFKDGYETAVKDFYYGKLKCEIKTNKVIWK